MENENWPIRYVIAHRVRGYPEMLGAVEAENTHETFEKARERLIEIIKTTTLEKWEERGVKQATLMVMGIACFPDGKPLGNCGQFGIFIKDQPIYARLTI